MSKGKVRSADPPSWKKVNLPPESIDTDFSSCCANSEVIESPIDAFYSNIGDVLRLGMPDDLDESRTLGRLLALGIVTGAESYFRSLFSALISLCPLVRERVSEQMVPLGALDYYGAEKADMGLFEGVSFASESEIKKRSNSLLGFTWKPESSLGVALRGYDVVCHIRHASVHSHGVLSRGNAKAIGLDKAVSGSEVILDFPHLQKIALICTNVIREYNSQLHAATIDKWIKHKILKGAWSEDRDLVAGAFVLFRSKIDNISPRDSYRYYMPLRSIILKRWNE
ncbi:hypothetical protein [Nocardiopsis aegyptia]|uniref:Uncharacterized protein n=1 Tax=Nocardiopsis aegyptia TaxID=220378 RepID=A0A7Z0ENM1_9ACTN|nr:hypothetical protein [Nocardiopsis aegyptia]NYJ35381.1 hypothetical protein [Nocardiopsis aegyptia]